MSKLAIHILEEEIETRESDMKGFQEKIDKAKKELENCNIDFDEEQRMIDEIKVDIAILKKAEQEERFEVIERALDGGDTNE